MNAHPERSGTIKDAAEAERPVASVLAEHPFLHGLSLEQLKVFAGVAMRVHYQAGEVIFSEGDPANRFYLIEAGTVALESHHRGESAVPVQIVGPGDVLGWSWLYAPYYWNFDARAIEPTTAIFFYGTPLREHCEKDHTFGYELLKRMGAVMIRRLQATRKKLLEASQCSGSGCCKG